MIHGLLQKTKLNFVPPHGDDMRAIADTTPLKEGFPLTNYTEMWIDVPSKNVILCRYNDDSGEWWNFEYTEQGPLLVQHSGWDTLE